MSTDSERMVLLREGVADLGGPLFAVRSPLVGGPTVAGWGRGSWDGTGSITMRQAALSGWDGGEVETETALDEWSGRPDIVVSQLLGSDLARRPEFPVSSTVTREEAAMRVAGRRRRVDRYRCGSRWIVPLRTGARHVTVTGRTVDPAAVEVVRLTNDGVEQAVAAACAWDKEFRAMGRAEQAAGRSSDRRTVDPRGRTRQMVAEIGEPLFAAVGAGLEPPRFDGGGPSGRGQSSIRVESGAGGRGGVAVTTMTGRPVFEEDRIVHRLISSDVSGSLEFPVTSTIHRGKLPMRVAGRRRPVTIYLCGSIWIARTRTGGRWLWIDGWGVDPRTIEVVPLDPTDGAISQKPG